MFFNNTVRLTCRSKTANLGRSYLDKFLYFTASNGMRWPISACRDVASSSICLSTKNEGSEQRTRITHNNLSKEKERNGQKHFEDYTFPPKAQDYLLKNVDHSYLKQVCRNVWFTDKRGMTKYEYLETAEVLPKQLPVRGAVMGLNKLWINLICQVQEMSKTNGKLEYGPAKNVTFCVIPDSPYSYMTEQAIKSLAPGLETIPEKFNIQFFPAQIGLNEVYKSPINSNFRNANILGTNVLKNSKLALFINYRKNFFEILETSRDEAQRV